jgi:hypothetical protein
MTNVSWFATRAFCSSEHVVALLDAEGRIVATTDASGTPDPAFVKAIVDLRARP